MSRLREAWADGSEAAEGYAERAAAPVVTALYLLTKLTAMAVDGALKFVWAVVGGFIRKIPRVGPKIADGLINAGNKMKLGKSDVICNVIYGDGVVIPRRATWQSDKTAFETDNGELFYAKGIGYDPKRLNGKVPTVWALRHSSEITEPLEAAITTARKLGRFQQFVREGGDPDVAVDIDPNGYDYGPGVGRPREQAVTDGGVAARGATAGAMHGGSDSEYVGTVLSFRDAFEQFGTKVDQEEMQQQETRGKLSVLDRDNREAIKTALLVLGGVIVGLLGPSIAAKIAGSSSGALTGGISGIGIWIAPAVQHLPTVLSGVGV